MTNNFAVVAAAGSLRSSVRADAVLPNSWTEEGVAVKTLLPQGPAGRQR